MAPQELRWDHCQREKKKKKKDPFIFGMSEFPTKVLGDIKSTSGQPWLCKVSGVTWPGVASLMDLVRFCSPQRQLSHYSQCCDLSHEAGPGCWVLFCFFPAACINYGSFRACRNSLWERAGLTDTDETEWCKRAASEISIWTLNAFEQLPTLTFAPLFFFYTPSWVDTVSGGGGNNGAVAV